MKKLRIFTQYPEVLEVDTKGWLILPYNKFLYRLLFSLFSNNTKLLDYAEVYSVAKDDEELYPDYMMFRIRRDSNKSIPNLMFYYQLLTKQQYKLVVEKVEIIEKIRLYWKKKVTTEEDRQDKIILSNRLNEINSILEIL